MADQDRDRYGDKMRDVERGREDDYFARRDRELIKKMRNDESMRCPTCGSALVTQEGTTPTCPRCPRP